MDLARRALCIAFAVAGCTPFSGGASDDAPDASSPTSATDGADASTDSGTSPDSSLAQ